MQYLYYLQYTSSQIMALLQGLGNTRVSESRFNLVLPDAASLEVHGKRHLAEPDWRQGLSVPQIEFYIYCCENGVSGHFTAPDLPDADAAADGYVGQRQQLSMLDLQREQQMRVAPMISLLGTVSGRPGTGARSVAGPLRAR